jgi:anti-anti-sigma regulatory factor
MDVSLQTNGLDDDVAILRYDDGLTGAEATRALWEEVHNTFRNSSKVVLDLSRLENIDTRDVGILWLLQMWGVRQGRHIKVCASGNVAQAIHEANLGKVLHVYPSQQDALAAFQVQAELSSPPQPVARNAPASR